LDSSNGMCFYSTRRFEAELRYLFEEANTPIG
jgi:hypothetical protein